MLDIWSQNTLELAGVVAPKHNKKVSSPISKPSFSSGGAGIDDTFSEVSSFVSESTAMTEAFDVENTSDGVQGRTFGVTNFQKIIVLRSKMKRRRRREAKRANLSNQTSLSRSYSGGSDFNDSLSAITSGNGLIFILLGLKTAILSNPIQSTGR